MSSRLSEQLEQIPDSIPLEIRNQVYDYIKNNLTYEEMIKEISKPIFSFYLIRKDNIRKNMRIKYSRTSFGERKRERILIRDKYTCQKCGFKNGDKNGSGDRPLHIDHIVPLKFGGSNNENNLQVLCDECNLKKNSKLDYYREQKEV